MLLGERYSFALQEELMPSHELLGRCWDHEKQLTYDIILAPDGQTLCSCSARPSAPHVCSHAIGLALLGWFLPLQQVGPRIVVE